jgi:glycosyltransferase involved in cell wall biosynthesis
VKHRILHILSSPDRAGAEKQLLLLARGLPRDRFDLHVCLLGRGGPLQQKLTESQIPTTLIGRRGALDPLAFWQLQRHVAGLRPHLVHTWLRAGNTYGRAAALAGGVKHMVAHEQYTDPWKGFTQLAIDRLLSRYTDRIVVNSPAVREFYVGRGLRESKFALIASGVAPAAASRFSREEVLAALHLPAGARLVGVLGRLSLQKRIKDAIWVTDLFKVFRPDVHLLIFGDGPQRARLHQFRRQVRILDKVHFLGQRDDVPDWLPHFDVLLSTSNYEGHSNAILEAMAAGVPVVASDVPGTRDLVESGVSGYLVAVGNRPGFTRAIHRLLDDASLAERFRHSARARVESCFSVEQMVAQYVDLYSQLLL